MKFVVDLLSFKKSTKTLLFALFCLATIALASESQRTIKKEAKSENKSKSFMKKSERETKESKGIGELCHKDDNDCEKGLVCKKKYPDYSNGKYKSKANIFFK